jgi:hypothetical protein
MAVTIPGEDIMTPGGIKELEYLLGGVANIETILGWYMQTTKKHGRPSHVYLVRLTDGSMWECHMQASGPLASGPRKIICTYGPYRVDQCLDPVLLAAVMGRGAHKANKILRKLKRHQAIHEREG